MMATKKSESAPGLKCLSMRFAVLLLTGFLFIASPCPAVHAEGGGHEGGGEAKPGGEPGVQDIDTFMVNLADPGGKRYLKLTMKVKLDVPATQNEFTIRMVEIRDAILILLSSKEYEDISGAEGKAALKRELMVLMNKMLKTGQVQDIYLTDFLIQ